MPTVLRIGAARFYFFSNEGVEPPHIHIEQAGALAKFWLEPVGLVTSSRFSGRELRRLEQHVLDHRDKFLGHGVTTSGPDVDPRAVLVSIDDDELAVTLVDGRRVIVPLAWFPRLLHAKPGQRQNWRLLGDGQGIHWPDLDEDLSVLGLLRGSAAPGTARRAV